MIITHQNKKRKSVPFDVSPPCSWHLNHLQIVLQVLSCNFVLQSPLHQYAVNTVLLLCVQVLIGPHYTTGMGILARGWHFQSHWKRQEMILGWDLTLLRCLDLYFVIVQNYQHKLFNYLINYNQEYKIENKLIFKKSVFIFTFP